MDNVDFRLCDPENIQVVVMMGGLGTRLKEYTADCPKPLVSVNGRPFFDYEFDLLRQAGFRKFVFCAGYRADMIEAHYGDGSDYGVSIRYSLDDQGPDAKLLGTGGAIRKAMGMLDDDFMVTYADSFMDIDYGEVIYRYACAKAQGARSLMTLFRNFGRYDTSNVIYEDGKLVLYDKKNLSDRMQYIDYGVSMFEKSLFAGYAAGEKFDLADIQHRLSEERKLEGLVVTKRFYEIGSPDSYREFIAYAHERFDVPHRAVFLDRDGTINEIVYNEDTEQLDSPMDVGQFRMFDGAADAIRKLKSLGYYVFVVTNQPSAAKGKTSLGRLYDIDHELRRQCEGMIDDVFMCAHYPKEQPQTKERFLIKKCECRKPLPGLIKQAMAKYSIDAAGSYMAGDSFTDIQCGRAAGVRTVFVGNYKCDVCARLKYDKPDMTVSSIGELAEKLG